MQMETKFRRLAAYGRNIRKMIQAQNAGGMDTLQDSIALPGFNARPAREGCRTTACDIRKTTCSGAEANTTPTKVMGLWKRPGVPLSTERERLPKPSLYLAWAPNGCADVSLLVRCVIVIIDTHNFSVRALQGTAVSEVPGACVRP